MWLEGIPIPPSLNNAYPTGKWGRRYKSKELVLWEREFTQWAFLNMAQICPIQNEFKSIPVGRFVAVNCIYYFRKERVLCKDGRAKRLDADNRLKILLDSITKLIGFDDSLIWKGSFTKCVAGPSGEQCQVELQLIPIPA